MTRGGKWIIKLQRAQFVCNDTYQQLLANMDHLGVLEHMGDIVPLFERIFHAQPPVAKPSAFLTFVNLEFVSPGIVQL